MLYKLTMKAGVLVLLILMFPLLSKAQRQGRYFFEEEDPRYTWERIDYAPKGRAINFLTFSVSPSSYSGDVGNAFQKWTSIYEIGLKLNKKQRINGKISVAWGRLQGQEENLGITTAATIGRNNFFNTSFFKFQYELQLNLFKSKNFAFFIAQGIGAWQFTVRNQAGDNLQDIRSSRAANEDFDNLTLILPSSLGAYYLFDNGYGFGLQLAYLNPRTDYIDNVSQLGNKGGNDQVFQAGFQVFIPLQRIVAMQKPKIPTYRSR